MARTCKVCNSTVHPLEVEQLDEQDLYICGIHGVLIKQETEAIQPIIW